ncbi:RidA family protein [Halopelagius longus]|uniref:Enamine deaminase RidA, house cleaning of reactive enamine intermediates, YjgF/YER057c/UK114 family n=1 Tax=Halopelagius longus TaxID=1236180 RepID=A0A1H1C6K4_9EURY|nr:RidA family protein [Halopelagius longus]RDI71092.1 RidA family protein [Halopelagius longus]SDQ59781.1 Enamine deaminase RidA, house cleaning of reactive enamine intermediates, YjgF/YER057c/UK114 family [Halopelagius longus]
MRRDAVSSGTEWEPKVGYSRAVRTGETIRVSGTTATDEDGDVVGVGDAGAQTRQALSNVVSAVEELGGGVEDVVRTRMYVVDIEEWEAVGEAHGSFFRDVPVRPASTMVEVSRLVDPELLVEIEAEAVVEPSEG